MAVGPVADAAASGEAPTPRSRLLAHGGAALTWVTAVAAVLAHVLNAGRGAPLTDRWLANVLTAVLLTTPGWVIASGRPRNVVGGLLVAAGLAQSVTGAEPDGRVLASYGIAGGEVSRLR